jgi:hypothetical protein
MNLSAAQVGMVGDRLFTDILAGNRVGMFTILVEPIQPGRLNQISMVRAIEIWISQWLGASFQAAPCNGNTEHTGREVFIEYERKTPSACSGEDVKSSSFAQNEAIALPTSAGLALGQELPQK